jgi:hypothetical protein
MFDERAVNLRKLRGTKYFICGQDFKPFDPNARLLFTDNGYRVYEASDPMEQYTLVHGVVPFINKDSFRNKVAAGFDYQHVAAVAKQKAEMTPLLLQLIQRGDSVDTVPNDLVDPISNTPNVFAVLANSPQPGLLILNERWSDAWHARVNSRAAKVLRANFTQPAVLLPAGRNYVEFEYKPTLFWRLLILQRVTILLLLVVGGWKLLRARIALRNSRQSGAETA